LAKYLARAKYTAPEGIRGLIADGGTVRVEAVRELVRSVGGTLESFYFALGDMDAYLIVDMPELVAGVSAALTVNASGFATCDIVALLSPEEMDEATRRSPIYDAPGSDA
jgi:uncharacterized protein with GYD domain